MKTLRAAAFVTIIGGLVALFRLAQALAIEVSYEGPHDLMNTVPLFLIFALISAGVVLCGVSFLQTPTRTHAVRVARACLFSLWILLAGLGAGAGQTLAIVCLAYFFVLKPAVLREFGLEKEPNQAPEPTIATGRGAS